MGKNIAWLFPLLLTGFAVGQNQTLENNFLKAEISPVGGKIVSLFDKTLGRELLTRSEDVYSGASKMRDTVYGNLATLSGKYRLSKPETNQVSAVYRIRGGNTAGMEITRIYSLKPEAAVLEISETWKSRSQKNEFSLNWHNEFPFSKETVFYFPVGNEIMSVDSASAMRNRLNLVSAPSEPWLAALDGKTGRGIGILVRERKIVDGMYVWHGGESTQTLEVNFAPLTLNPVAAADEWNFSGEIFPFSGNGAVLAVTPELVVTSGEVYFKKSLGHVRLVSDVGTLETEAAAGKSVQFAAGKKLTVRTNRSEFTVNPGCLNTTLKPATSMPIRKSFSFSGFRYYYPDFWLSNELPFEMEFDLCGNFKNKKGFRLVLTLPPGVEMTRQFAKIIKRQELPDGSVRYEIHSYRNSDYNLCVPTWLKLNSAFRPGSSMLVQTAWDGGALKAQKVAIRKIQPLPKLEKSLEFLKIELNYNDVYYRGLPPPDYPKAGINSVKFQAYRLNDFELKHMGEGYHTETISQFRKAGMDYSYELWEPFPHVGHVIAGDQPFLDGAGRLFHPESQSRINPSELNAVDITGKKSRMICPSYRGRYYEKIADTTKTAVDYGISHISYDEETWGNAGTICYCPRCKELFKKFLAKKYPSLTYIDPASPDASPALTDAWWDFKTDLVAEIYAGIRKTFMEYRPEKTGKRTICVWLDNSISRTGRYNAISHRLTDYRKLSKIVDYILPMCYNADSEFVGKNAAVASELASGGGARIIMGLGPNRMYERSRIEAGNFADPDAPRRQILESVFNGAIGVSFWKASIEQGAMLYYKTAQAAKMLLPLEKIIVKGKKIKLETTNPEISVSAYELDGAYAVFLRNYDGNKVSGELVMPKGNLEIIDTFTGEKCGTRIELGNERVKTLLMKGK